MKLRIGFLGMSDNLATRFLLEELNLIDVIPDVIILENSKSRGILRRVIRKVKNAGLIQTCKRALVGISLILSNRGYNQGDARNILPANVLFVSDLNGQTCKDLLLKSNLDVALLCTDNLIKRAIFSIPKLGMINAHPGWIPAYRGIGSTLAMLRDGFQPAISVHYIDEGVDTGPLICRRTITEDVIGFGEKFEKNWLKAQAKMFSEALQLIEKKSETFNDTFCEPSNMTRGIPAKEAQKIIFKALGEEKASAFEDYLQKKNAP